MTAIDIIQETVDFYSEDISRRAYNSDEGGCEYYIDGRSCGVGKCMTRPKEFNKRFPLVGDDSTAIEDVSKKIRSLDSFLKPEYRGHSIKFWKDIQTLHDLEQYWIGYNAERLRNDKVRELKEKWGEKIKQN